jgi:hypothetical protein
MQINQLPTRTPVELKENSTVIRFYFPLLAVTFLQTRQNQNQGKVIVRKKIPSALALSTNNDAEDLTEHVFSSACSPLTSPTEQRDLYDVSDQDGCKDIWDKQKSQKNSWNTRNGKDRHLKYLQESPPSSSSTEGDAVGKESHYKSDLMFSEDVDSLFQDFEEHHEQFKIANGRHRVEAKGDKKRNWNPRAARWVF